LNDPIKAQLYTARRIQILDAASKVFVEKGFHSATIKDIAGEADISEGTIYNYFKNKPALLLGVFERMRKSLEEKQRIPDMVEVNLRTFIKAHLQRPIMALKEGNFELFRIVVSELMVDRELRSLYHQQILAPVNIMVERYIEEAIELGNIKSTNSTLTAHALTGLVYGIILQYIIIDEAKTESDWDELTDMLTDMILYGLEGDK